MNKSYKVILLIFICITYSLNTVYSDELVTIKSVSVSRKTFIIDRGRDEKITVGQKKVFSTKKVSIVATAVDTSPDYSLWQVDDPEGVVPFDPNEIVVLNTSSETIWSEIAYLQQKLIAIKDKAVLHELSLLSTRYFILRGSLTRAFSETTSYATTNTILSRVGAQLEFLYNIIYPEYEISWAIGPRYDYESLTLKDADVTVPTSRYLATADFYYYLKRIRRTLNNIYVGLGVAAGISQTTINQHKSVGIATILPIVRFGYQKLYANKNFLILEASLESISAKEVFKSGPSTGREQTTNIVNGKMSIGIKF